MGAWYWVGVLAGIGVALGVGSVSRGKQLVINSLAAVLGAVVLGFLWKSWPEAIGGGVGAACGGFGAGPIVSGALRRGGTRFGVWLLVVAGAVGFAALAFVPVLGYLEALAVPTLGLRLRRRAPDRHAGLRTLTKD